MLIKRTERQARRGSLAARSPTNRTAVSIAAPSCAAPASRPAASPRSARCRSRACARPRPARRPLTARRVTIRKNICTHCSVGCTVTAEVVERRLDRPGAELGFARSTAARIAPRAPRCANSCTATAA